METLVRPFTGSYLFILGFASCPGAHELLLALYQKLLLAIPLYCDARNQTWVSFKQGKSHCIPYAITLVPEFFYL